MTLEFYPQDGCIRVFEPEEDNSGLWSGDFAKKHIPRGIDGEELRLSDIASSGTKLFIHGRAFIVADADVFVSSTCTTMQCIVYESSERDHGPIFA